MQELLSSDDPKKHTIAAAEIGRVGHGGSAALPLLMEHFRSPHPAKRSPPSTAKRAVWSPDAAVAIVEADLQAMVSIAPTDGKLVRLLVALAKNPSSLQVRLPGARAADADLIIRIDATRPAVASLGYIAGGNPSIRNEILPILIQFVRGGDREPVLAYLAMLGLVECGPAAGPDAVVAIQRLTEHKIPLLRAAAFEALKEIGDPQLAVGTAKVGEEEILSFGTAFAVAAGGYYMTNVHVIAGDGKIRVRLPGVEKPVPAEVVARHPIRDIAIIKVALPAGLSSPALPIADRSAGRGTEVAAFGFPLGDFSGKGLKLTKGVVSAVPEQTNGNMLLIDAKINPGNSGGPLCDAAGNVVGMVTAKSFAADIVESYGLAIPSNELAAMARKHIKDYKAPTAATTDRKWNEVDKQISPSVVTVLMVK